ncbi:MAG: ECF transporter S component [Clostridia bacterium]
MNSTTKSVLQLVLIAMFTALTTVVTWFIQIPNPATGGYVNIGDSIIFASAILLGPIPGFVVGGLGSCLADICSGYAHWALPTFIIKGIEGFICGMLAYKIFRTEKKNYVKLTFLALASILSAIVMVTGYFFANLAMGGIGKAVSSIIPNICQGALSFAISIAFISALLKTKVFNGYLNIGLAPQKQNLVVTPYEKSNANSDDNNNDNTTTN